MWTYAAYRPDRAADRLDRPDRAADRLDRPDRAADRLADGVDRAADRADGMGQIVQIVRRSCGRSCRSCDGLC